MPVDWARCPFSPTDPFSPLGLSFVNLSYGGQAGVRSQVSGFTPPHLLSSISDLLSVSGLTPSGVPPTTDHRRPITGLNDPIPTKDAQALYKQYAAEADKFYEVSFIGRLGTYQYYNMDQVVGIALKFVEKFRPT